MRKMLLISLLICFAQAEVVMNIIPIIEKNKLKAGLEPLRIALEKRLGEKVIIKINKTYKEGEDEIATGKVDLAFIGPIATAKLTKKSRYLIPLVKLVKDGKIKYRGVIIVAKNSPIKKMRDFKNKKFAFGDPSSTLSSVIPEFMLRTAGVKLTDLKKYYYTGSHSNVIKAVINGQVAGGGVKENLAKKYLNKLRILKYTMFVPTFTILANAKYTDREKLAKIKSALLEFKNSQDSVDMGPFGRLDGFKRAYKNEYRQFYDMVK